MLLRPIRFALVTVVACLASLVVPLGARADDDPGAMARLPFTPPPAWTSVPLNFLRPVASWSTNDGQSALNVSTIPVPLPPDMMQSVATAQGSKLGAPVSSVSDPICGQPAVRLVLKMYGTGRLMTEQIQALDGATYITAYLRPPAAPIDPAIGKIMDGFCGPQTVAAALPPDWHENDGRMLGVWIDADPANPAQPKQGMSLFSQKPEPDPQRVARAAAATALQGSDVTIVSTSKGLLCGKPATFVTAHAKTPAASTEQEVRMEITGSDTAVYVLVYSHAAASPASDEAVASLATLCAP